MEPICRSTDTEFGLRLFGGATVIRRELKFCVPAAMIPGDFVEQHPPCRIHNVYYDTPTLTHYRAHVNGISNRMKVRRRWYEGNRGRDERIEFKGKVGNITRKTVYLLDEIPFEIMGLLDSLQGTLENAYLRHYYVSRSGKLRITVDTEQTFNAQSVTSSGAILELKFSPEDEREAQIFCSKLSLRTVAHSKYVTGMKQYLAHGQV